MVKQMFDCVWTSETDRVVCIDMCGADNVVIIVYLKYINFSCVYR